MGLSQLIYVSRLKKRLTAEGLRRIVDQSESSNARIDVSGVLLVNGQSAMQLLEGDVAVIEALFEKIQRDDRHEDIAALMRKSVKKRLYPHWGMGLADLRAPLDLDRPRMVRMIDDIRRTTDTREFSVEARILLRDFEEQARLAA